MKKNIVLGLVGFVVGGIVSYLYCKKRFDEGCCDADRGCFSVVETDDTSYPDKIAIEKMNSEYGELSPYGSMKVSYESPRTSPYKMIAKLYASDDNDLEPRVITESQFSEASYDYDKITVLYYNNGIITDDRDEPIDDVDDVIGVKNLAYFGYGSSDKDILYVRNDRLKILYEVLRQNTEYEVSE